MKRWINSRMGFSLLTLALAFACSKKAGNTSGDGDGDTSGDGDGDGDLTGSGGEGILSGAGGSSSDGSGGLFLLGGAGGEGPGWLHEPPADLDFSYDPNLDATPEECVDLVIEPEVVQLDMFLVLDRSGSMDAPFAEDSGLGDCSIDGANNGSRWCNAIKAIHGFMSDPSSVEMGVAYTDFAFSPCAGFDMTLPFNVIEAADANGHVAALESALDAASPGSGTNTEGAVRTIINQTAAHIPIGTRKTIGILVTDGEPYLQPEPPQFAWQTQACDVASATVDGHLSELNDLLVAHYEESDIPTFVIGMSGVEAAQLELLAAGAGAERHADNCISGPECSYYSVGNGNPTVFKSALEKIRRSVVGCDFVVPNSQVGLADLGSLEVSFTPDAGEDVLTLTRQPNLAACSGDAEYYLDVGGTDPVVRLCPEVCELRGEDPSVEISVTCEGS